MARMASSSAARSAPPMTCGRRRRGAIELVVERALGLLAGADDDGVGRHDALLALHRDVHAGVVDPAVGDARHLRDLALGEQQPQHPAGADAEPAPHAPRLALQHHHLRGPARARGLLASPPRPAMPASTPHSARKCSGAAATSCGAEVEELGDIEADAAGADDGDARARPLRAPRGCRRSSTHLAWSMPGMSGTRGVTPVATTISSKPPAASVVGARRCAPSCRSTPSRSMRAPIVAQRLVELLLARHVARQVELAADARPAPRTASPRARARRR